MIKLVEPQVSVPEFIDPNIPIVGLFRDLALVARDKHREWAYKRAAATIMGLPRALADYVREGVDLLKLPNIGPGTARYLREYLETGESASLDAAIERSGKRLKVEAARRLRDGFLSHAGVRVALDGDTPVPSVPRGLTSSARPPVRPGRDNDTRRRGQKTPISGALVAPSHYRGDFQMHSEWSDGAESLESIVEACRALGQSCACVTDHSAGLPVARGVSPERFREQHAEIDRLNAKYAGRFRMFKGIEGNLGADGMVDVAPEERHAFDLVVAAPHSALRSEDDQTERMVRAVSEPGVHILGHPRGRKFGSRAGVRADWDAVFARAARTGVAIEIDGSPDRQDLDYRFAARALDAGCLLALDSDAHAHGELPFSMYAIAHARLAGAPAARVINCWPDEQILDWASTRHSRRRPTRKRGV